MISVALLLVLLINLIFTAILIAGLYYLSIRTLEMRLESQLKVVANRPQKQDPLLALRSPEGVLPDLDDVPLEAFYGDDEEQDYRTTPEDVEEALTERPYTNYNRSQVSALAQLKALNSDGAA
jgi:hypothetical protein